MTNEEAIAILKTADFSEDYTVEEVQQALDMAIRALKNEQTDGDLIYRQAVIGIVEFECGEWKGLAKTIVKAIEQLSPATLKEEPERVMCATCKHYDEHRVGMLAVERWCRSPIWERAGRAPHPINHDGFKLIMCDYYERMEGQNDGKV